MNIKKDIGKFLLIFILVISSIQAFSCGNEYGHKMDGTTWHSRFFYLTSWHLTFDTAKLKKQIAVIDSKYGVEIGKGLDSISFEHDMALSNKALALMKLGKTRDARIILEPLVKRNPNEYSMAANLGTVYELSGELDSALKYISKGLKLNPNSHGGSEWIHVELLKAKIKRKRDYYYIQQNPIISKKLLESKIDTVRRGYRRSPKILEDIYRQVKTRAAFTPAPNEVICNLLLTAGDYAKKYDSYENAFMAYAYAIKYAKGYAQNKESAKRMKELNNLREKLTHDKELESMFFHILKRARISPKLLLMGLDDLVHSLDSVQTLENRYQSKIDSLEDVINKPEPVKEVKQPAVIIAKNNDDSKLPYYIAILALSLSTVFFAFKIRTKD